MNSRLMAFSLRKPPNGQLSAAPLAGVWRVEDGEERQLRGNARVADPWSAGSVGVSRAPEGCALPGRQQAGAFCRVDRAQPTNRASGVSCTAWFGGWTEIVSEEYYAFNCKFFRGSTMFASCIALIL